MEFNEDAVKTIQALVAAGIKPLEFPGAIVPAALVPEGYKVQNLQDLIYNDHMERPERIKQTVTVLDPNSFVEYHNRFCDDDSRTFAYEPSRTITSVLDYHEGGVTSSDGIFNYPRWGQHKLVLQMQHSEEWKIWTEKNNKQMSQQEFAEFLEQHSVDIVKPESAYIRELADQLEVHVETDASSAVRQKTGEAKFRFNENTRTSMKGAEVDFPDSLILNIPVFVETPRIPLTALLRFRLKDQKITFFFTLVRPQEVVRAAFALARQIIQDGIERPIINGSIA